MGNIIPIKQPTTDVKLGDKILTIGTVTLSEERAIPIFIRSITVWKDTVDLSEVEILLAMSDLDFWPTIVTSIKKINGQKKSDEFKELLTVEGWLEWFSKCQEENYIDFDNELNNILQIILEYTPRWRVNKEPVIEDENLTNNIENKRSEILGEEANLSITKPLDIVEAADIMEELDNDNKKDTSFLV